MTVSGSPRDWHAWHAPYDDPESPLSRRLRVVQERIRVWLQARRGQGVCVVSVCAGRGRDLLEVLADLPQVSGVRARLVELDRDNVDIARRAIRDRGRAGVEVVEGDAGALDAYRGTVPADLVLLCGVLGNISDDDVWRTLDQLPQLCAERATVIWTRSRRDPDLTPAIRRRLAEAGFAEQSFDAPDHELFSVGVHRFEGRPQPLVAGGRLFRFVV